MAEFDAWASYYDLIHRGLPGEAEFYVGQAVKIGGKTLELGVGTGRVAIAMAMSGCDVTGLDNAAGMLAICREKMEALGDIKGSLSLVQGDMANFSFDHHFDFIAMPYRAFMHLQRPEQQRQCLRRIYKHLSDDGIFMLNTWIPQAKVIAANSVCKEEFDFVDEYSLPDTDDVLSHFHRATYDEFRQRIVEDHYLEERSLTEEVLHTANLSMIRTWTTPRELDNLLRLCGFKVEATFGDFECNPTSEKSTEMIWVLRK